MPFITIDTNARTEVTAEMLDELSEIAVRVLNKPKNYVTVKINSGVAILFGDTTENIGALVEFKSIGFGDKKAELARQLKDFAVRRFGAEGLFVGIHFADMPAANVSHDGKLMG